MNIIDCFQQALLPASLWAWLSCMDTRFQSIIITSTETLNTLGKPISSHNPEMQTG